MGRDNGDEEGPVLESATKSSRCTLKSPEIEQRYILDQQGLQ